MTASISGQIPEGEGGVAARDGDGVISGVRRGCDGGGADVTARRLHDRLAERLRRPVREPGAQGAGAAGDARGAEAAVPRTGTEAGREAAGR